MLSTPISIPIDGTATSVSKINQDAYSSEWRARTATGSVVLKIRHTQAMRNGVQYVRHNVELTQTILATETVPEHIRKVYFVLEVLPSETSIAIAQTLGNYFLASESFMNNLLNWES